MRHIRCGIRKQRHKPMCAFSPTLEDWCLNAPNHSIPGVIVLSAPSFSCLFQVTMVFNFLLRLGSSFSANSLRPCHSSSNVCMSFSHKSKLAVDHCRVVWSRYERLLQRSRSFTTMVCASRVRNGISVGSDVVSNPIAYNCEIQQRGPSTCKYVSM